MKEWLEEWRWRGEMEEQKSCMARVNLLLPDGELLSPLQVKCLPLLLVIE